MSLLNIPFELREILKEAIKQGDYKKVNEILSAILPSNPTKEEVDGVLFKEVKDVIDSKESLENLLFSSKILFESKEEILEFFNMLLKYNLEDTALTYFEDIMSLTNDNELMDGFNKILRK